MSWWESSWKQSIMHSSAIFQMRNLRFSEHCFNLVNDKGKTCHKVLGVKVCFLIKSQVAVSLPLMLAILSFNPAQGCYSVYVERLLSRIVLKVVVDLLCKTCRESSLKEKWQHFRELKCLLGLDSSQKSTGIICQLTISDVCKNRFIRWEFNTLMPMNIFRYL